MIGTILGIILGLVVALGVAGAIIFRSTKRRNKKMFLACAITACACFVLFMTIPFSIHTVQPGQVAVVKVWGDAKYTRSHVT